ncbi:hypothetical protein AB0425_17800 [Actinosynnema sp. NPDC051121]
MVTPSIVSQVVVDHPATAWRNSDQGVLTYLPDHLVEQYRAVIDTAATNLIARHLIDVWRERGYVVAFSTAAELDASTDGPSDEAYLAVWDEAAGRIDSDLLGLAALDDVLPSNAWPYQRIYNAAAARVAAAQESR